MLLFFPRMSQPDLTYRITLFLLVWGLVTAGVGAFFWRVRDAASRKKALPWFAAIYAAVFLAMAHFLGVPDSAIPLLALITAAVAYLNVRAIRFCSQCGTYNQKANFCRACGKGL